MSSCYDEYNMIMLKKLIFAPLFLIIFFLLTYQLKPLFGSYDFIFSLSLATLIQLITISVFIILSSFLFCLEATITSDWKIVVPLGIFASLLSLIFLPMSLGIVFIVAALVSFIITFVNLEARLKTYLNFEPASILGPSIRNLTSLLIITFALTYFLSINQTISEKSFQIPDSLIDAALKFTQPQSNSGDTSPSQLSLSQDQLDLLKKNPDLLRQSGLDPKILDTLNSPKTQNTPNDAIKKTIQDQLQNLLKPYSGFIPITLAIILFLTLQSITSVLNLLIYLLLWITFYILEKSGFVRFEVETRSVKKMVL